MDILTIIVNDINAEAAIANVSGSVDPVALVGPNYNTIVQNYISDSKIYAAVLATCVVWTPLAAIFIMSFAHKSKLHLIVTIPGSLLAVGGTGILTWCVVDSMANYEPSGSYSAMSFGPDSIAMWVWMSCVLLLTPLTAMISVLVATALLLIMLWLIFICVVCMLVIIACVSSGRDPRYDDPYYS
jgi:hypothetical protein